MQMDRLEVEVVAWGWGEESWSVEVHVIWGDPLTADPWNDLEDFLAGTYTHETGVRLPISATVVDTGGTSGMTAAAYEWLQGRTGRRIFGGKGIGGWGRPIAEKPTRKQTGKRASKFADLVRVGVDEAKLVISRRLALVKHGPGFCHFPEDEAHDQDYFRQLTAERLVVRYVKGQQVREWHKNDRDRNEKLDCRVYAYAAMKLMQPPFKRIAERMGVQIGAQEPATDVQPKEPPKQDDMRFRKRTPPAPTAPPAPAQEKPQEAAEAPPPNNPPVKRPQRPKRATRRGSWASTW
jgi:phage terminase large subunit GpA-like protein